MPVVDAFSAFTGANGGTPSSGGGAIVWVLAADYNYTLCATSARVSGTGTVPSGLVGLPNMTLGSDNLTTYGVTPTSGTGFVLDCPGTARGFIHFTPDWVSLGVDQAGVDAYAVELQLTAPVFASSAFSSFQVGSAANPNGSGSGAGGRLINSGGTRTGAARSNSSGTSELSSAVFTSASDPAVVSFLGGFGSGESLNGILNGSLPANGPAGYTVFRDGATRAIGTGAGFAPGFVSLLFGGGVITGGAISRVRVWRRGVV